jgi:hypothetical protein
VARLIGLVFELHYTIKISREETINPSAWNDSLNMGAIPCAGIARSAWSGSQNSNPDQQEEFDEIDS